MADDVRSGTEQGVEHVHTTVDLLLSPAFDNRHSPMLPVFDIHTVWPNNDCNACNQLDFLSPLWKRSKR